jgi:predicted alpha/beta superfamily hydrolase
MKIVATLAALLLLPLGIAQAAPEGKPVVVPRALQYDIPSRVTGRTYRVWISVPPKSDPTVAYPVVYVFDGNEYFDVATRLMTRMSNSKGGAAPGIIVGIGYPLDDDKGELNRQRFFELTPSVSKSAGQIPSPDIKTGGGDAFLQAVDQEIKPFVEARYKVDKTKQILFGHSLGGLTALRQLFRRPEAFSAYVISSPSIWWNDKEVLADEAAFSRRARAGELHIRILVTSAGDEQYRGEDPKLLAAAAQARMVDNASELAERLSKLDPKNMPVVRTIFAGETHISVSPIALDRGLRFALPLN